MVPWVMAAGTAIAPAATVAFTSADMSSESGPSKGSQPGNATTPSTGSKKPK